MKRLLLLATAPMLITLLTILLVSEPPVVAEGQPVRVPPTATASDTPGLPDTGVATLRAEIDSNTLKAAQLNDKTRKIMQGQDQLSKTIPKLVREVKKEKADTPIKHYISTKPDTVRDTTCVFVHDNTMDGKGWWYQYRGLLKKCTIGRDVKRFLKCLKCKDYGRAAKDRQM